MTCGTAVSGTSGCNTFGPNCAAGLTKGRAVINAVRIARAHWGDTDITKWVVGIDVTDLPIAAGIISRTARGLTFGSERPATHAVSALVAAFIGGVAGHCHTTCVEGPTIFTKQVAFTSAIVCTRRRHTEGVKSRGITTNAISTAICILGAVGGHTACIYLTSICTEESVRTGGRIAANRLSADGVVACRHISWACGAILNAHAETT